MKGHASVSFWMQRVAEEYSNKAKELIGEADCLHWQNTNIESMNEVTQEIVINGLYKRMIKLGWEKEVEELKNTASRDG